MKLTPDLKECAELFNANRVEFLIVGAYALAYYGHPRYTGDLDVFVRPTQENGTRIVAALAAFGFGSLGMDGDDFAHPDRVVQLGVAPNRLDILTSLSGLDFDDAWRDKVAGELGGVPVFYLSKESLIRNKEITGRAQDLADVQRLRGG